MASGYLHFNVIRAVEPTVLEKLAANRYWLQGTDSSVATAYLYNLMPPRAPIDLMAHLLEAVLTVTAPETEHLGRASRSQRNVGRRKWRDASDRRSVNECSPRGRPRLGQCTAAEEPGGAVNCLPAYPTTPAD